MWAVAVSESEDLCFLFPQEYDRCPSIKNNHFINVEGISYPVQLIAAVDAAELWMRYGLVHASEGNSLLLSSSWIRCSLLLGF